MIKKPLFEFRIGRFWLSRPTADSLRIRKEEGATIEFMESEIERAIGAIFEFRHMLLQNKERML